MNRPAIMGIVNVTPDSFSGDGVMAPAALAHANALMEAGADILDIGAESTRPGATPLSAEEEWTRLEPVLEALAKAPWRKKIRLSVDTRHADTAARALVLGVEIINDVGGLRDAAMRAVLGASRCDIVVMHALSIPADPSITLSENVDMLEVMRAWQQEIIARAAQTGIAPERLIFDPGIGFGKTAAQSLSLVEHACEIKALGMRWLYGHSRKSFLKLFTDAPAEERDALTLQFSAQLARSGIDILRVHDVAGHAQLFAE
jgi:dihydropteroate synthase